MKYQFATGRCFCGEIEFQITFPTDFLAHCHCQSCRRSHATAFVTWTSVPLDRFAFKKGEGDIAWYPSSKCILWGFCKKCGSSMLYRAEQEGHPEKPRLDRMYISAGCLDRMDRAPECHVSFEEHSRLLDKFGEIPKYRGKTEERID